MSVKVCVWPVQVRPVCCSLGHALGHPRMRTENSSSALRRNTNVSEDEAYHDVRIHMYVKQLMGRLRLGSVQRSAFP